MPKVICTIPNASELINDVQFISHKLGVISEEIEQDVADMFLSIKGFVLAPVTKTTAQLKAEAIAAEKEQAAIAAEAKAQAEADAAAKQEQTDADALALAQENAKQAEADAATDAAAKTAKEAKTTGDKK